MQNIYQTIILSVIALLIQAPAPNTLKPSSINERLDIYPKSAALSSRIATQLNADWHLKQKHLLFATYFLKSPSVAINLTVDSAGAVIWYRDVYDWAMQDAHNANLQPDQQQDLKRWLTQLPDTVKKPSLETLVMLSYQAEGKWVTRLYDKTELPEAVQKIYELTGVPIRYINSHLTSIAPERGRQVVHNSTSHGHAR